jgi:hypothetical protein
MNQPGLKNLSAFPVIPPSGAFAFLSLSDTLQKTSEMFLVGQKYVH